MPPDRPPGRFLRFLVTGGIGFVADAVALQALVAGAAMDPVAARLLSIAFALTVTWLINRHFTFTPSSRGMLREGARYGGVGLGASLLNFTAYAAIMASFPAVPPLAALVVASATAMALSWLGYSRIVFDR